jgi:hypothetical protein
MLIMWLIIIIIIIIKQNFIFYNGTASIIIKVLAVLTA